MRTLREMVWIALLGLVLGLTVNALRPSGLAMTAGPELTATVDGADTLAVGASDSLAVVGFAEVDAIFRKELAIFVDARSEDKYLAGHVPGAVSLPTETYREGEGRLYAPKGGLLVVYCDGGDCELSHELASLLLKQGWKRLRVYEGGWEEWESFGMPVSTESE